MTGSAPAPRPAPQARKVEKTQVQPARFLDPLNADLTPRLRTDMEKCMGNAAIAVRWRTRIAEIAPGTLLPRNEDTGALERTTLDRRVAARNFPNPSRYRRGSAGSLPRRPDADGLSTPRRQRQRQARPRVHRPPQQGDR